MKPLTLSLSLSVLLSMAPSAWAATLTHGPIVGNVTPTSATVFIRTNDATSGSVRVVCCAVPLDALFSTTLSTDFTALVPVSGLVPGISYTVQVFIGNVLQSATSTFKAFPVASSRDSFLFGHITDFAGPTQSPATPGRVFERLAAENPAFVLIGGDFDHRNPGQGLPPGQTAQALENYREMFKSLYDPAPDKMPELVTRILRAFPIAHVWDDHDYGANNTNKTWKFRDQANQAFREYTPAYPLPAPSLKGIRQRFTYGTLAEFFLLDLRSQRDPNSDPDDGNKSMLDGNRLDAAGQLEWLKAELRDSAATWKFVLSTVPWNSTAKKGTPGNYDNWAGFTNEQIALKSWITANGIKNVVILSGDAHMGALDNGFWAVYPEMVTPAANFTGATPYSCANLDVLGNWTGGTYGPGLGSVCNGYSTVLVSELDLVLTVKDDAGTVRLQMIVSRQ